MSEQPPRKGIAGFQLTERTRITELGTWIDSIGPDGTRAGALRFDPKVIGLPGVKERLVETVVSDQRLVSGGVGGLVPVVDVVAAGDDVWLLTGQSASPTLSDLINAPGMDASGAAAVLVQTAQTLLSLHAAGLVHGSVHPGTVVIAGDGAALLSERGLADAVRGMPPTQERDIAAWGSLARGLAATWAAGVPGAAALFERAAAVAATHGLAAARDTLLGGRDALPGGLISRDALAMVARRWAALDVVAQGVLNQDEGDIVTLLHVPGGQQQHFGPGVSTEHSSPVEEMWRAGRDQLATASPRGAARAGKVARKRRTRTIVAAAVLALMIAGLVLVWLWYDPFTGTPLAVQSVQVTVPKKTLGCDKTMKVSGTFLTNGQAGTIEYEWRKSDTKQPITQKQTVREGQKSVTVPLLWTVKGQGSFKGTATLRVLSPAQDGKTIEGKTSFTYKC
ncbi:hypothetical protein ACIBG8_38680 [Nonomuraea sp. NPDC050556]|uniref:hypothetical protein n=1 Tax=Nonomuraea sp. NPDC050556 TaxID=3364369 RepID=UPI0037931B72